MEKERRGAYRFPRRSKVSRFTNFSLYTLRATKERILHQLKGAIETQWLKTYPVSSLTFDARMTSVAFWTLRAIVKELPRVNVDYNNSNSRLGIKY